MTIDTATRMGRMETGRLAERRCKAFLEWHGLTVNEIGQEYWLPSWVHGKIRFNYDADMELLRHLPDFDVGTALVQVKAAPSEVGYPTVCIEEASYRVSLRMYKVGIPVLLVWLYQDQRTLMAQWVQDVHPEQPKTDRSDMNGSQTPTVLVRKNELRPLKQFIGHLKNGFGRN